MSGVGHNQARGSCGEGDGPRQRFHLILACRHAVAAQPISVMNSRRLMPGIGLPPRCRRGSYQLEPPGAGGLTHQDLVLGVAQNCDLKSGAGSPPVFPYITNRLGAAYLMVPIAASWDCGRRDAPSTALSVTATSTSANRVSRGVCATTPTAARGCCSPRLPAIGYDWGARCSSSCTRAPARPCAGRARGTPPTITRSEHGWSSRYIHRSRTRAGAQSPQTAKQMIKR